MCNRPESFVSMLMLVLVMGGSLCAVTWAEEAHGPPFVALNGHLFHADSAPMLVAGRVLLPLQDLIGAIGGHVDANAGRRSFTVLRGPARAELEVDAMRFTLNDTQRNFTVPPLVIRDAVYVDVEDLVTAFGGVYRWDAAQMTGHMLIRRVEDDVRTVRGALVYFVPAPPAFLLVRAEGEERPNQYWGAANIEYHRRGVTGPSQPTTAGEMRIGDRVELSLDGEGKARRVVQLLNEVEGVVDWAGEGFILLSDRTHYFLTRDVAIVTETGDAATLASLEKGRRVTLTINPDDGTATRVVVHTVAPPTEGPRIVSVAPESEAPLRAGRPLVVHLEGTPGGRARFDVSERIRDVAMTERSPGKYRGQLVVRGGMDVAGAPLIGRLRVGDVEAPPVAADVMVVIDTVRPTIEHVSPGNGETIGTVSPTLLVRYTDGDGSGIDRAAVTLRLNRTDVTREATIDELGAFYQARDLQAGAHTFEVRVADRAGNELRQTFRFTVQPVAANKVIAVQHDARGVLTARGTLTVQMDVQEPGRRAWFVIGDKWREVNMARVAGMNAYRGTYVVRAGDEVRDGKVVGYLEDREGRMHYLEATTRVSISTALPDALTITSPQDGERVATGALEVTGQAPPNRKVRVAVQQMRIFGSKSVHSGVTISDAAGRWRTPPIHLRLGILDAMFAGRFAITAQLLDEADNVLETQRVTISVSAEE